MVMGTAEMEQAVKQFTAEQAAESKPEAPAKTEAQAPDELTALKSRLDILEKENQRLKSIEGSQRQRTNTQADINRINRRLALLLERDEESADPAFKEKLQTLSEEERTAAQQERLSAGIQRASERHAQSLVRLLTRHSLKQGDVPGVTEIAAQWGQLLEADPSEDAKDTLDGFYSGIRDLVEDFVVERQKQSTAAAVKEAEEAARGKVLKERTRASSLDLSEPPPAGGTRSGKELIKAFADFDSDDTKGALELAHRMGVRFG